MVLWEERYHLLDGQALEYSSLSRLQEKVFFHSSGVKNGYGLHSKRPTILIIMLSCPKQSYNAVIINRNGCSKTQESKTQEDCNICQFSVSQGSLYTQYIN